MTCSVCRALRQIVLNVALMADHALNTGLLGDPNETLSRRIARAREAGERWAHGACRVLAFILGRDHCAWALTPGTIGEEVWHWSDNDTEPELSIENGQK